MATTAPLLPAGQPEDLVDALVRTSFATMAILTRLAAEHELSLTQLRVFGVLRDRRLRMTDLAAFLGLDKSTMTGLVDRAEKRELLVRARNADDGRATDVYLSPAGLKLAEDVHAQVAELLAPSVEVLGGAEQRRLHGLLLRMLDTP